MEMRQRTGVIRELAGRAEQCVLRSFLHVERIEADWLVKRIVGSDVRGRSQMGWLDGF